MFSRMLEERAGPIDAERLAGLGGRQKPEGRDHTQHLLVVLFGLARKAVEDVPRDSHRVGRAPLQETDVLQTPGPLVHQPENVVAEALDPRLDLDTGRPRQPDLLARDIGTHVAEERNGQRPLGQRRQHLVEEGRRDDGVREIDHGAGPGAGQSAQLIEYARRTLAAVLPVLGIHSAEAARSGLRPPAAARGLGAELRHTASGPRVSPQVRVEIGEVRGGQRIEVARRNPGRCDDISAGATIDDPLDVARL